MINIYVGNLPRSMTADQLKSTFSVYGNVEKASIITDRDTGQSRGFAFVEMTDDAEAQRAIEELNGKEVEGRALTVNLAKGKGGEGGGRDRRR